MSGYEKKHSDQTPDDSASDNSDQTPDDSASDEIVELSFDEVVIEDADDANYVERGEAWPSPPPKERK